MDRIVERLVPAAYREIDGGMRRLARTFGIAVGLRLVLMPLACHADLISTYHRTWLVLRDWRPAFWVPHELIQSVFLALYSPFLRLDELLVWRGQATASYDFWIQVFAPHPQANLAIFLFKIPYLLADVGIALVLLRIFESAPRKGLAAVSLWIFNPITIFAFYVFGRHDAVALFFMALCLLALRRGRPLRSALAFGVAAWSRYWPLFVLPFLLVTSREGWRRRALMLAVALLPLVLFNVSEYTLRTPPSGASPLALEPASVRMVRTTFTDYLLGLRFDMGFLQQLFVYPLGWSLLFLGTLATPLRGDAMERFARASVCCLCIFYATSFFHPQYFTWFILFLVVIRASSGSQVLRNLHYLQIALFVPYTFFWKRSTSSWLLAVLSPETFSDMLSPVEWIEQFGSPFTFVNLVRTALTAVCLAMAGWVFFAGRERSEGGS